MMPACRSRQSRNARAACDSSTSLRYTSRTWRGERSSGTITAASCPREISDSATRRGSSGDDTRSPRVSRAAKNPAGGARRTGRAARLTAFYVHTKSHIPSYPIDQPQHITAETS